MQMPLGMNFMEEHGNELREFLRKGVISEFEVRPDESSDGMLIQRLEDGPWSYENRWYAGEPATGITTVRFNGKACWSMVYFSRMLTYAERNEVYNCLREALKDPNDDGFLRGPSEFHTLNGYTYANIQHGSLTRFDGLETVKNPDEDIVFKIHYRGGAICVY